MIVYQRDCLHLLIRSFQCTGSVFPSSLCIAVPCSVLTACLKILIDLDWIPMLSDDGHTSVLKDNSCWSGFVFLVGFLTVFRTSQAYARFWDGCTSMHRMHAEWYDACASLIAFCKCATADQETVVEFQRTLIRLFSMLHAVALADIEDTHDKTMEQVEAFKYDLVDPGGLDTETLRAVRKSPAKVELVFQWIQQLIVQNIETGVLKIPPPILSRSFQEIGNGMVAFREAMKISTIPFPFPYAQVSQTLLILHWLCTPLVVSQYVSTPWWGALFSFLQVFVYWSMNAIAIEIENPFGMDANDLDAASMQGEMNRNLLLLIDEATQRTPTSADPAMMEATKTENSCCGLVSDEGDDETIARWYTEISLTEVWEQLAIVDSHPPVRRTRRRRAARSRPPDSSSSSAGLASSNSAPLAMAMTRTASASEGTPQYGKAWEVRSATKTSLESSSSGGAEDERRHLGEQKLQDAYSCVPSANAHLHSVHIDFVDAPSQLLNALALWGGGLAGHADSGQRPRR